MGGCTRATGFEVSSLPPPQRERTIVSTANDGINQLNFVEVKRQSTQLGTTPVTYHSPRRMIIKRTADMEVPAVYKHDNSPAVAVKKFPSWRSIYIAEAGGLTPEYLNEIVKTSGGYVTSRPGLQVDMNGNFISIHCLETGKYDFSLPFAAEVRNLKNGERISSARSLTLDLTGGETRWYSIRRLP
jgi:hypothetical protein